MSLDRLAVRPSRPLTFAGYFGFVLIGWNFVLLPSLIRPIEHDFGQSDAAFGLLYFVEALAYACGTLGGGFLTERIGRKWVLSAGALLAGLGLAGESLAPSWILFMLSSMPVMCGGGAIDGGINGLFLDLYREARGGALNFLHLFFGLGSLLAPFLVGLLVTGGVSWRVLLFVTGGSFLLLTAWLSATGMPSGRHDRTSEAAEESELTGSERSLLPFFALAFCIGVYVAAEAGVSSWLVRLLSNVSLATATRMLSIFWIGLALGRLLSRWVAERFDYFTFTIGCFVLASVALVGAVMAPWLVVVAFLFGLTGLFYGPIFPMIMALGGNIYPHRLAALSGGLTTAAVVGGLIYRPLMGIMESRVGLTAGMIGAALLGIPGAVSLIVARITSSREDSSPAAELVDGQAG